MKNKLYQSQVKLYVVFTFFLLGCKNESSKSSLVSSQESKELPTATENVIIKTLRNNEFTLNIETHFSNDTLDVIDYKEDPNSSPIILEQKAYFLKDNKLITKFSPAINFTKKKTITRKEINALQTPIYRICLVKTMVDNFYLMYGSDYCNGSDCPEFTGIYTMDGKVVYEGISTIKGKIPLKDILLKYKIELNKPSECIDIDE